MPTITANVPLLEGVYDITIDGQAITSVDPSTQTTDLYAGPTLFDVQVNGYGGRTCRLAGPQAQDALVWIARLMHELGVGWWMPTITTSTPEVLETAFTCCGRALDEDPVLAASIPGLHLEGPYISPVEGPRGAHQLECVRTPDWDEFCRVQDASCGRIRLVTVAPEVALTDATYVPIGPKAALRDGKLVTAEGWTALAAFMREFMNLLGTEIIHHPVGALDQAEAAE